MRARPFLLGVAISCAGGAALGYLQLRSHGADVRLRPVEELNKALSSGRMRTAAVGSSAARAAFGNLLEQSGFAPESMGTIADVVRLQTWVGNNVGAIRSHGESGRGYELLMHARQGGGLLCGGMSDILREALALLGVPARTIQLYESSFRRRSSHVVVEVFVTGRWRVFDPTYNVTYEGDGDVLGIAEIQERLDRAGPDSIRPEFHGKRLYPADLERDVPGWRQLFANAYVSDVGRASTPWTGLPPWRYWTGPRIYYFGDELMPFLAVHEGQYLFVTVVMPAAAFVLLAIAFLPTSRPFTPHAGPGERRNHE